MENQTFAAFFVPFAVLAAFAVHWLSLLPIRTAEDRLERSRGAYLGLSLILVLLAWGFALLEPGVSTFLLALGMTTSFAGDLCNLQFPALSRRLGQPLAWGIACFMVAQVFYIAAFLSLVPLATLVAKGFFVPLLGALTIGPALLFRLGVYDPTRPRSVMLLAFVYGFILGAMGAVAIAAAIARGGAWIAVAAGAVSFLVSDAIMGNTTIKGLHPRWEFQLPWGSYLLAQGLIVSGFALLAGAA